MTEKESLIIVSEKHSTINEDFSKSFDCSNFSLLLIHNSFDDIFLNLQEQYNKNETAVLNEEQHNFLNNIADFLEQQYSSQGIHFVKANFINFVKRFSGEEDTVVGGSDTLTTTTRKRQKKTIKPNMYDFAAICSLFLSVFLIYLSYAQFNKLACKITGSSHLTQIPFDIKDKLIEAIQTVTTEEFTFMQYMYNVFTAFSLNIVTGQTSRISTIIQNILSQSVPEFTTQIQSACLTSGEGWSGFFETAAKTVISSEATSQCITKTSQELISNFLINQQHQINMLITQTQTSSIQIQNMLSYGTKLGYASITYLIFRIYELRASRIKMSKVRSIKNGGKSKKQKRQKNQKKSKKQRKSKKTTKR